MSTMPLPSNSRQWSFATSSRTGKEGILHLEGKRLDVFMSMTYFAIGFSPITALALAIIGILPLSITTLVLVLPAALLGVILAVRSPAYGRLALKGLIIGLLAVFLYDCMRVPFILAGAWGDFIPNINKMLFNTTQPNWVVGYTWRYVGDGAFMGMAFTVGYEVLKPRIDRRVAALTFGVAIWICLVLTLLIAPHGQQLLFKLTPVTLSLSLLGHLIYGAAIGFLLPHIGRRQARMEQVAEKVIPPFLEVGEELIGQEETIKLPRLRAAV